MPSDRRPLASRDTRLAARIARALADRGVSPNHISQVSVAFAALAGGAFWASGAVTGLLYGAVLVVAALGCQLRLLCNLFDGMVAVEGGRGEADGAFWNEAPDRVADILILVGMGYGAGAPALGWAAATLAVMTAYIRELGSAQGLAADFRGPMAKPHRMALVTGAAVLAIFLPQLAGWPVLVLVLWLIVAAAALTALRRSAHLIAGLRQR
jgi:phosphatidylglycerophosphate synthase